MRSISRSDRVLMETVRARLRFQAPPAGGILTRGWRSPGLAAIAAGALIASGASFTAGAEAKTFWQVRGAGFGHGVGMSQYGAYGFAQHGVGYQAILKHYYRGTSIAEVGAQSVRVLLAPYQVAVRFTGASAACGTTLSEAKTYSADRNGSDVLLHGPDGKTIANCGALLSATGGAQVTLIGKGRYRGAIEARASSVPGKLNAINRVGIEDYVRGVVARESPSSWPIDALRAQAVAARSYGLAGKLGGNGFDFYDDTRSQVYGGVAAETAKTDAAVADTALETVQYGGKVATTYFFSTSGGRTESNENSFGGAPRPYLRSVKDPYDDTSPLHRWTKKFSLRAMRSALADHVQGRLRRIKVIDRGVSPRIITAKLIGTRGVTLVSGSTLRAHLGLYDTWAYFKKRS